jgi:hypothetical protein
MTAKLNKLLDLSNYGDELQCSIFNLYLFVKYFSRIFFFFNVEMKRTVGTLKKIINILMYGHESMSC